MAMMAFHLSTGNSSTGATCWMPALLRTMFAPCLANASAMPRPMPLVEPVTSAVLPFIMGTSGRVNAFMVAQSRPALQFGKIAMIRFSQVSLIRGTKLLLEGADVALNPGERIGLIGANGSGKSSLFALLRGELHTDKGELDYPAQKGE